MDDSTSLEERIFLQQQDGSTKSERIRLLPPGPKPPLPSNYDTTNHNHNHNHNQNQNHNHRQQSHIRSDSYRSDASHHSYSSLDPLTPPSLFQQNQHQHQQRPYTPDSSYGSPTGKPPPPPSPPTPSSPPLRYHHVHAQSGIASLDFETVINDYSIEATRERFLLPLDARGTSYDKIRFQNDGDLESELGDATYHETQDTIHVHVNDTGNEEEEVEEGGGGTIKYRHRPKLSWRGYTGRSFFRWVFVVLTGALTGLVTILILVSTDYLVGLRLKTLSTLEAVATETHHHNRSSSSSSRLFAQEESLWYDWTHDILRNPYTKVFAQYATLNLTLALLSSAMCLVFAPEAVGSGIPETIAYLNGVRVRKFTDVRLFLVKVVGTVLSVSSSLAVGPEGPCVHLGAVIGAGLTKNAVLERWAWRLRNGWEGLWSGCYSSSFDTSSRSITSDVSLDGEYHNSSNYGQSNHRHNHEDDIYDWDNTNPSVSFCGCSSLTNLTSTLSHFRNDAERRDLITIGAASGFASAFGAPIGGLLFSMEEASTFFSTYLLFKTLVATATATLCVALFHGGDLSEYGVVSLSSYEGEDNGFLENRVKEVPLYVAVGTAGGLLGAVFNRSWKWMQGRRLAFFQRSHLSSRKRMWWKLYEVALVSLFTSTMMFFLPVLTPWSCRASPATSLTVVEGDDGDASGGGASFDHRLDCPASMVNELGVVFFGSRDVAIKSILADPDNYDPRTLLTVGLVFFPLMMLTFGVSLPSGIFMPTVLVGSALGGYAGIQFKTYILQHISTSTYALLGAAALLAGIQRNVVSLCVILVEGTGQTKILIPVVITVVVARYVGDLFGHGIYHVAMEIKGYPYLDHHVRTELTMFRVEEIMSPNVKTLRPIETVGKIERLLLGSSHYGFPVVENRTGRFLGLVRRDQLVALLQCGIYRERKNSMSLSPGRMRRSVLDDPNYNKALHTKADEFNHIKSNEEHDKKEEVLGEDDFDSDAWLVDNFLMSKRTIHLGLDDTLPHREESSKENHTIRRRKGDNGVLVMKKKGMLVVYTDPKDRHMSVDIGATMNRGAYSVTEGCPVSKAYEMFTALGLRHLVVLGGEGGGEVKGILTRSNFNLEFMENRTGCEMKDH